MKKPTNERRKELRQLSRELKELNQLAVAQGAKVNDLLINYYNEAFHTTELNTYDQWKEKGFQVKKGSVSYMVWATPRTIKVKRKEDPSAEPKDINDFFAVCHLFDVSQVVRIENQQN